MNPGALLALLADLYEQMVTAKQTAAEHQQTVELQQKRITELEEQVAAPTPAGGEP